MIVLGISANFILDFLHLPLKTLLIPIDGVALTITLHHPLELKKKYNFGNLTNLAA